MAGKQWSEKEIEYLKGKHQELTCAEIGKKLGRTTRSVQHKFNQLGFEKRKANVGETVKGWLIVELFDIFNGQQNVTHCVIKSTLESTGPIMKTERLSRLTNKQIGYPDRRRKDNIKRNTTHGMSGEKIYSIWSGMRSRCDPNNKKTNPNHAGKGIRVCDEWQNDFESFMEWSKENGYIESVTSLDRIDSNGNYDPSNCRWVDWGTQQRNKENVDMDFEVTAFGETKPFYEWCEDDRCVVFRDTLKWRIRAGWDPEDAITQPSERKRKLGLKNWLKQNHPKILEEYQKA
jgi:hypothetical protein